MRGPTEILADYIAETNFEDLPNDVVHKAKMCILDSLGCAIGGYQTKVGQIVVDLIREMGGKPQSTIIAARHKTSSVLAVFANSTMANALDYDDTLFAHPGATTIPPALVVGEDRNSSGREFITSVVVGYEVMLRIGYAIMPSDYYTTSWKLRGLGTFQTFGAVAAASKLLDLNKDYLFNALGIAGANAPVASLAKTVDNPLGVTMVKNNYGVASTVGVLAALLALRGFTGPKDILDGERGFWRMYGSDRCDFNGMTEKLGKEYKIMNVEFKPYPACRGTHKAIDAALSIMQENMINVEEIDRIVIKVPTLLADAPFNNYQPKTMPEAQFSLPYTVAVAISKIKHTDWYDDKTLTDVNVAKLAKKILLIADSNQDKLYPQKYTATVEMYMGEKRYIRRVEFAKGSPQNPMKEDEIVEKFNNLALTSFDVERARQILEIVNELEKVDSLTTLTALLY